MGLDARPGSAQGENFCAEEGDAGGDIDEEDDGGSPRPFGAWANAYGGYEKRTGRDNEGEQTTVGSVAGFDVTIRSSGDSDQGLMLGVLGGYSETREDSDGRRFDVGLEPGTILPGTGAIFDPGTGSFSSSSSTSLGDIAGYDEGNGSNIFKGWFAGLYGSYFHGRFSMDGLFKAQPGDISLKTLSTLRPDCVVAGSTQSGSNALPQQFFAQGSVSLTNYTAASNIYFRIDADDDDDDHVRTWVEPTIGVRYSYVDFGSGADVLDYADGHVWRVQAGVRINKLWINEGDGSTLLATFVGLFYSDVEIDGFRPSVPNVSSEDEGKVRVKGKFRLKAAFDNGFSANGQAEVYGGQDLLGVSGRVGGRIQF